jgi:hypothetical protein
MDPVGGLAREPIATVANVAARFAAEDGVPSAGGAWPADASCGARTVGVLQQG